MAGCASEPALDERAPTSGAPRDWIPGETLEPGVSAGSTPLADRPDDDVESSATPAAEPAAAPDDDELAAADGDEASGGVDADGSGIDINRAALTAPDAASAPGDWQRALGAEGLSVSSGGLAVAADGSASIAGSVDGDLDGVSSGSTDAFVARYSAAGDVLFLRQLGTPDADAAAGVSVAADGSLFVTGSTGGALDGEALGFGDAFLVKYSSAGELLWVRQLGTSQPDDAASVSAAADGGAFVVGVTRGVLDGARDGADQDAFVARFSPDGELLWTRQLGSQVGYDDRATGVSVGDDESVYVSGQSFGGIDADSAGSSDAFVAKYSAAGELSWVRQVGGADFDVAEAVSAGADGEVYVAGQLGGVLVGGPGVVIPGAPYVAKYSSEGELLWAQTFEDAAAGSATSVTRDANGQVLVAGYTTAAFAGPNQGLYDTFVATLSGDGERVSGVQLGVAEKDQATGVGSDGAGNVFVSGEAASATGAVTLLTRRAATTPEP
jgi:hypothetical protein